MSEENNCNANLDKAIAAVKSLGGVKAFVLVAAADGTKENGASNAVCAMSGRQIDLMSLMSTVNKKVMKDIVLKELLGD